MKVAEHTGLLSRLTDVVLGEGLRRCRQWADSGRPLNVAVNLSSRTLIDPDFPARVERMLAERGVAPEQPTFEITEAGVVNDSDRPMPILNRLRDMGVRLSVDDFGTGYSSLSYLSSLPISSLKVDRSFVHQMAKASKDTEIVKAVIGLGTVLGKTVIAEGIETPAQLSQLRALGCRYGQGYLLAPPLAPEMARSLLVTGVANASSEATPPVDEAIEVATVH